MKRNKIQVLDIGGSYELSPCRLAMNKGFTAFLVLFGNGLVLLRMFTDSYMIFLMPLLNSLVVLFTRGRAIQEWLTELSAKPLSNKVTEFEFQMAPCEIRKSIRS